MERTAPYDEQELDLKLLLLKVWKHKGWVLFSLLLALAVGYAYWQKAPRVYEANMTVLFKDQNTLGYGMSEEMILQDMGFFSRNRIMQNEIEVLQSPSLMMETVEKLGLQYQWLREEEVSDRELYADAPLWIDSTSLQGSFRWRYQGDDRWIVEDENQELEWPLQAGKLNRLASDYIAFRQKPERILDPKERFTLKVLPSITAARDILGKMEVERPGDWATILQLRLESSDPQKARDILSGLIESYAAMMRAEKNEGFERSLTFIKERIADLSGELSTVEGAIENYKEENRIAGEAGELVSQLSGSIAGYDQERSGLLVQREVLQDLKESLENQRDDYSSLTLHLSQGPTRPQHQYRGL